MNRPRAPRPGQQLAVTARCRTEDRQVIARPGRAAGEPEALLELRSAAADLGGGDIRTALRGDLHCHSDWSDGSAPIEEMMTTAAALGHEYCALTDHSPRLKIANGLAPGPAAAPARRHRRTAGASRAVPDSHRHRGRHPRGRHPGPGPELLDRLDIVVASVHSKLAMDAPR